MGLEPLGLAALTFFAYLGSGGSKRIFGIFLVIFGLLVLQGALTPVQKVGYTSTTTQVDANTTQTTLTYTYQPVSDWLTTILGVGLALVGIYLILEPSVGEEEEDKIDLI